MLNSNNYQNKIKLEIIDFFYKIRQTLINRINIINILVSPYRTQS